jgi:hypothetical protein
MNSKRETQPYAHKDSITIGPDIDHCFQIIMRQVVYSYLSKITIFSIDFNNSESL